MMDLPWALRDGATVLLGALAGVLSGGFSMGGQVIMKPGIRALGASALDTVGTTVPMILPTVASATISYAGSGLIDWRAVRWAGSSGALGAVAGSIAAPIVPGAGHLLQVATGGLMLATGVRMLWQARRSVAEPVGAITEDPESAGEPEATNDRSGAMLMVLGLLSGVFSGLLGVGGGIVMVPAFHQLLRHSMRAAIATSLVCGGIFAIPATVTHAALGTVQWRFALLLIVGAVPGARLGAAFAIRTGDRRLRGVVAVMISTIAVTYIVAELIGWLSR
jgi:uncharacterized protein